MNEFREITESYLWQVEVRYLMTDLMIRDPNRIWLARIEPSMRRPERLDR